MSAALQLPLLWGTQHGPLAFQPQLIASAVHHIQKQLPAEQVEEEAEAEPVVSWAFYRKHTEKLLRRYLYASLQVGRSPNILGESIDRGWVSSRKVRTFEDALIFVLDIERCLKRLDAIDRMIILRILLQEHTHTETAALLGVSERTISTKLPRAIDRLTEWLVKADLLSLPE